MFCLKILKYTVYKSKFNVLLEYFEVQGLKILMFCIMILKFKISI